MARSRVMSAVLLVAALAIGGCGGAPAESSGTADSGSPSGSTASTDTADDAPSSSPTEDATAATAGGSTFPVTIEHALGETVIEQRPERVVSLSVQWTDALLALGVQPTAYVLDGASGETDPYPWQQGRLDDSIRIDASGEIPFEDIAALDPDLVLVAWQATDPDVFALLEEIAPTIGLLGERQVDRWQDQVEVLGQALGSPELSADTIADVHGEVDAVAEELPGLDGKTYVLANYVPTDAIYVVADPDDGASELFNQLGMHLPQPLLDVADDTTGRVQISFEQVELLDGDLLGILPNGGDPHDLPGYDQLTAVERGAVAEMAFADVVGVNTPTPISIPHVLELLRPALEAAASS